MKRHLALFILILWPLSLLQAQGFFVTAFWGNQVQVKITTGAQTNLASLCSGGVIIEHQNASGTPTNAAYDIPLTLGATGSLQVFSDSMCLVPISAATITTGSSSTSVYLLNAAIEASTLTVGGPGISDIQQVYTTNTNNYVWKGTNSTDWNTASNWSGGAAVPGAGNVAVFDGTCAPNCSPVMSSGGSTVSILGLRMNSGYAGTINQSSLNVAVGTIGFAQASGAFTGTATPTTTFTVTNGNIGTAGGTFSLPAGTLTLHGSWYAYNSPTITAPASSTVTYDCGSSAYTACYSRTNRIQTVGSYQNLNVYGRRSTYNMSGGTTTVAKNLIIGDVDAIEGSLDNGVLQLGGDVTSVNQGHAGTALIVMTGNASGQTIFGGGDNVEFPGFEIATGSNPVTLNGFIDVNYLKMTSVGTFTTTGSTLELNCAGSSGGKSCYNVTVNLVPGTVSYNNVTFYGQRTIWDLGGGTMTVAGSLTVGDLDTFTYRINNGQINAGGDVYQTAQGYQGTGVINLTGNPAGQTIHGTGTTKYFPKLSITAGANPVTLDGTITTYDWVFNSAGTFTTTGSELYLNCYSSAFPCFSATNYPVFGNGTYNDLNIRGNRSTWNLGGGTVTVAGSLTFGDISCCGTYGDLDNGVLRASGPITQLNYGYSGDAKILVTGNPSGQTITGNSSYNFPSVEIDTGANAVTINGALRTWDYDVTSVGAFVSAGSTLYIYCAANQPCRSSSTTIHPGSVNYETVLIEGWRTNWNLAGGTMNVLGDFYFGDMGGVAYGWINSGDIRVGGNVQMINTGYRGDANIVATGNVLGQIISGSSAGYFPQLKIDSGANAVTLSGQVLTTGSYQYISGSNVVTTGSTLGMMCPSSSFTNCYTASPVIIPGPFTYENVIFNGYRTSWSLSGATMTIAGSLTMGDLGTSGARSITNSTFAVSGGLYTNQNGILGDAKLIFQGANTQTVDLAGTNFPTGIVTVDLTSPGVLNFMRAASFTGANQKLTVTAGSLSLNNKNLTVAGTLTLNAGTQIFMGGGTISYGALSGTGTIVP